MGDLFLFIQQGIFKTLDFICSVSVRYLTALTANMRYLSIFTCAQTFQESACYKIRKPVGVTHVMPTEYSFFVLTVASLSKTFETLITAQTCL